MAVKRADVNLLLNNYCYIRILLYWGSLHQGFVLYMYVTVTLPGLKNIVCYSQGSILAVVRSSEPTIKSYGRVSKITNSSGG